MGLLQPPKVSFSRRNFYNSPFITERLLSRDLSPGVFSQCLTISLGNLRDVGIVRGHLCAFLCSESDCAKTNAERGQFLSKENISSSISCLFLHLINFGRAFSLFEKGPHYSKELWYCLSR